MNLTIAGNDATAFIVPGTLRVEQAIGSPSTARFALRVARDTLAAAPGDEVIIHHVERVFGGVIDVSVEREMVEHGGSSIIATECTCVDFTDVLNRRLVIVAYRNLTVTQIIDDLLTNYIGSGKEEFWHVFPEILPVDEGDRWFPVVGATQYVGVNRSEGIDSSIASTNIDAAIAILEPAAKIFDIIADLTGAVWYITPFKQIIITAEPLPSFLDITDSGSPSESETNRLIDVTVTRDRDGYRNKEFVASRVHRKDQFDGNGTRVDFDVEHPVLVAPEVRRWNFDDDGTRTNEDSRTVSDSGSARIPILAATTGAEFGNKPGNETVDVLSDQGSDTFQTLTLIGTEIAGGDAQTETYELNGTTPVVGIKNWFNITAAKMDAPGNGSITIRYNFDSFLIAVIPDGQSSIGVVDVTSGNIYVTPTAILSDDDSTDLTIFATDIDGGTSYYARPMNGTTEIVFPTVVKEVLEVHIGNTQSDRTVTVNAPFEWIWTQYSTTVAQNGSFGDILFPQSEEQLSIEYDGIRFLSSQGGEDIVESENASEITARASAEGGTGLYEHFERVTDRYETNEAQALADALITQFSELPSSVSLSTPVAGFRVGQTLDVTLSKHGLSADSYTLQRITFAARDVDDSSGREAYVWQLKMSSQNVVRDSVAWFKRIFDWRE